MRKGKNIIIDGKSIGAIVEQPSDRVYFGAEISPQQAEYLVRCLERPLCLSCGREVDECDADPCTDRRIDLGELQVCTGCTMTFDPTHLTDGVCPDCSGQLPVFEVTVFETITYAAHIEATDLEQAERAVNRMDESDWEPIKDSADLDKIGYLPIRKWEVFPTERTSFITALAKREKLISAADWDEIDE